MEKVGRVLHKEASVAIRHRCPPSTSQGGWGHRGPLQLILPNHPRVPPEALRGCKGEASLRLGGAQRGERRAPKGGLPPEY